MCLFCITIQCQAPNSPIAGWQLVYKNDATGKAAFGNKIQLLDAVRLGFF